MIRTAEHGTPTQSGPENSKTVSLIKPSTSNSKLAERKARKRIGFTSSESEAENQMLETAKSATPTQTGLEISNVDLLVKPSTSSDSAGEFWHLKIHS